MNHEKTKQLTGPLLAQLAVQPQRAAELAPKLAGHVVAWRDPLDLLYAVGWAASWAAGCVHGWAAGFAHGWAAG